jgi:hypothetical protein
MFISIFFTVTITRLSKYLYLVYEYMYVQSLGPIYWQEFTVHGKVFCPPLFAIQSRLGAMALPIQFIDLLWIRDIFENNHMVLLESISARYFRVENLSPAMGWGIDSRNPVWNWVAKKHRLAGRYDNPIPTWFLAHIAGLKLPTQVKIFPAAESSTGLNSGSFCQGNKGGLPVIGHSWRS